MAFVEDPTAFLGDFGVTVTAGATSGLGILDMPGEYVGQDDLIISTDYTLRCQASLFGGLTYGDPVVVDGLNYTVRDNRLVDDGVFALLTLSRVAGSASTRIVTLSGLQLTTLDGRYLITL